MLLGILLAGVFAAYLGIVSIILWVAFAVVFVRGGWHREHGKTTVETASDNADALSDDASSPGSPFGTSFPANSQEVLMLLSETDGYMRSTAGRPDN